MNTFDNSHIYGYPTSELTLAHYRAFIVGLKVSYNDNIGTSKEYVIKKLREAADLDMSK